MSATAVYLILAVLIFTGIYAFSYADHCDYSQPLQSNVPVNIHRTAGVLPLMGAVQFIPQQSFSFTTFPVRMAVRLQGFIAITDPYSTNTTTLTTYCTSALSFSLTPMEVVGGYEANPYAECVVEAKWSMWVWDNMVTVSLPGEDYYAQSMVVTIFTPASVMSEGKESNETEWSSSFVFNSSMELHWNVALEKQLTITQSEPCSLFATSLLTDYFIWLKGEQPYHADIDTDKDRTVTFLLSTNNFALVNAQVRQAELAQFGLLLLVGLMTIYSLMNLFACLLLSLCAPFTHYCRGKNDDTDVDWRTRSGEYMPLHITE